MARLGGCFAAATTAMAALALAVAGCGGSSSTQPATIPVGGKPVGIATGATKTTATAPPGTSGRAR